jgi:DNA polymerase III subunit delta
MLGPVQNSRCFGSVLLITGPESLLAERAVTDFIAQAQAERPDAAVSRLESAELDGGTLAEATGASLFATATIAVINDLAEMPPELFDQVVELASAPGEDLALALVHGGGVKGKGLLDRVKKLHPEIVDCPTIKTWELGRFVGNEVRRQKGKISPEAAEALVQAVGSNTRALAGAVRQLLDDSADQVITETTVRRYFAGRAEVSGFAVADAALAGHAEEALGKLRWAMSAGVGAPQVTSALAGNLRGLGKYLGARDRGMGNADLAREIGVPPWKLKDLARLARDWRPEAIADAIQAVAVADAQVKGASGDAGFALEQAVLTILRCREQSRARR